MARGMNWRRVHYENRMREHGSVNIRPTTMTHPWQKAAAKLLRHRDLLSAKESGFLADIVAQHWRPTPKQADWLSIIGKRVAHGTLSSSHRKDERRAVSKAQRRARRRRRGERWSGVPAPVMRPDPPADPNERPPWE